MTREDELEQVGEAILIAERNLLLTEVMWSAIKIAREDPSLSIKEVMSIALHDWDL